MKRKLLFFSALSLLLSLFSAAQDFQWAKRGGSTNTLQSLPDYNNVIEMATDGANNVYLLCYVGSSGLEVDGHPLDAYSSVGIGATRDVLLTSFTKEGKYRWSKVIGGSATDQAIGLNVNDGLVYLGLQVLYQDTGHFSTDTVVVNPDQPARRITTFLIQYDTSGTFQWLVMPEADTIGVGSWGSFPYWLDVAPNGDVYWLCLLKKGSLPNTAHLVTEEGLYVLKYNRKGQLLDRIDMDIIAQGSIFRLSGNFNEGGFVRDHGNGRFYIGGTHDYNSPFARKGPLLIGGDTIKGSMYLAAFDSTGQVIWKKQSDTTDYIPQLYDFRLDPQGNIFLCGSSWGGTTVFNNLTFNAPFAGARPLIMKLDPNGNTLWGKLARGSASSAGRKLVLKNGEVAMTGWHGGLYFEGPNDRDTLSAVINQGYDAYIARFDMATGDLKGLESAETNFGGVSYGYSITADNEGSYYLGGNFDQQLFLGPDSLYKIGSQRSFFVAKYACNVPEAGFTVTNDSIGAFSFTYTGTEADSVLWDFGDGSPVAVGDSLSHLYTANGQFTVCATGYSYCGDTTYCEVVQVSGVGLWERAVPRFLTLAPNPARDRVRLHYGFSAMPGGSVRIYDARGVLVAEPELTQSGGEISTAGWNPGVYVVVATTQDGQRDVQRLVVRR